MFCRGQEFCLINFLVFSKRKPGTVFKTLLKVYSIHFEVQAGVGVQNTKMFQSRSGVRVYSTEAGVESEPKFQTPYTLVKRFPPVLPLLMF